MKSIYEGLAKRALLSILIVHFAMLSFAATYYISSNGSDSNSGLTTALAWKTLAKVNTAAFKAGDQILFNRGETFYGSLVINDSGTVGNPITFGAYGTGEKPIITGLTSVTGWTNLGNNIWESTNAVSTLTTCNMVVINGVSTAMGRYPNANAANGGYLTYQSHFERTSITSSSLTGTPNWTGAELAIRDSRWTMSRTLITSQTDGSLVFTQIGPWPVDGYGFFIQNDPRTLDQQNEWYYNPTTKKIQVYSTTQPTDVKVASVNYLVEFTGISNNALGNYTTFDNISFKGSNSDAIYVWKFYAGKLNNLTIQNCSFQFASKTTISLQANYLTIANNSISDCNDGLLLNYSKWITVSNNTMTNIGTLIGMAASPGTQAAISISSVTKATVSNNSMVNLGNNGIGFSGDSIHIINNFIDTFCTVLDDGGGIGTGRNLAPDDTKVIGNIVINGIGAPYGTDDVPTGGQAMGIYMDDATNYVEVAYNTVANCKWHGFYIHNASYINFHHNTSFNNNATQLCVKDDVADIQEAKFNNVENNILVSKKSTQVVLELAYYSTDYLSEIGAYNNNVYARPIDDTNTILFHNLTYGFGYRTLEWWKTNGGGRDQNTTKSTQSITSENDLKFEYNATKSSKTVALSLPMIDMKGAKYANSVTIQPFTSVVLMKDANPLQVVVPVYVSSVIENAAPEVLEITYNTSLSNVVPAASAFSVKVNSEARIVNSVAISGTKVMLTLASPLIYGDVVTVDYTKPLLNPIQTASEGQAVSVSAQSVINNVALLKQGSIPPTHFIPVWNGENGLNHMNIMVVSADLEDLPLSPEDEIAVFSGLICVGSMKLSETINAADNSTFLTIPASQDDGTGNGFTINDTIVFKIWDNKNQQEMIAKTVVYRNNVSSWLTGGKYVAGATSVVEIVSYTEYSQTIQLKKGYNMISTFVSAQNPMACHVTQSLADDGYLTKLQDEAGNSLENWGSFGGWVNNIGNLEKTEGYKIKVTDNCLLLVTGRPIALPLDIPLKTGWNIISFPRTDLVNAMNIIQPLIDQNKLLKVQDEAGNSIENWGIFGGWKNGIGYFSPGKAYKVKMTSDAVLTIQENYLKSAVLLASIEQTEYFLTEVEGNGSEHVNINIVGIGKAGIVAGDELAAFDGDICVGVLKVTENHIIDGSASLVASISSDVNSNDGFTEGHNIKIIAWNKLTGNESEVQADVISGQLKYAKNSSVLLNIKSLTTDVRSFQDMVTIDVFPNPSQGMVTVRFSNFPDAGSSIEILDISGRKVASRIVTGMSEVFNLDQQPAGVYLVKSKLGSKETINKLVIN